MSPYNIYALNYAGPLTSSGAFLMWMKDWDKVCERGYYLWCLKSQEHTIVVDAGVAPTLALERNLPNYASPAEMLETIDVVADEVEHVILTHLHWDHIDGVTLFPNATVYVQKKERDFWLHDETALRHPFTFYLSDSIRQTCLDIEAAGRLRLVDGDREILPGIDCVLAPGHSVALQGVGVSTSRGYAILGSDCGHLFRNYEEEWPSNLIVDMVGWTHSLRKLKSLVSSPDLLFPGHDPLMSKNYPEVAPGITQLA